MTPVVALARRPGASYPSETPFHPTEAYPELEALGLPVASSSTERNPVYPLLRDAFRLLGLDEARFGRAEWNPLGTIVPRGGTVVIKPNLVLHERPTTAGRFCLTTHAAVLRALIDYVLLAGGPSCRVVVADAPLQQADFERMLEESRLAEVLAFHRRQLGAVVEAVDLRRARAIMRGAGVIDRHQTLPGDPLGYVTVTLDGRSCLVPISGTDTRFAVTDYDRSEMIRHHRGGHHEYLLARTALACDAFINVPKLKTHQKVGVTLALKNLVGINGSKDWLPHYRPGPPERGGDEFPEAKLLNRLHSRTRVLLQGRSPLLMQAARRAWRAYRRMTSSASPDAGSDIHPSGWTTAGAWHGNDTAWRMVLDLNQAIFHADGAGVLGASTPRRYLALVDGIVGGEGDGPLSPRPKGAGLLALSEDAVALDRVVAHVMGFDPERIPMLREAVATPWPITALAPGREPLVRAPSELGDWREWNLGFEPAPGWKGHIEREAARTAEAVPC